MSQPYPEVLIHIDGSWRAERGRTAAVLDPATGKTIGRVPLVERTDLDEALDAAQRGFSTWRRVPAVDRCRIMRRAAEILRTRKERVARIMTLEQGKPLAEASGETALGADLIDWFAEEGRRAYGRVIPSRSGEVGQLAVREPVGPVAAFTPWNYPINQAVRKIAASLAAGCSIVLKGPEETPASCMELVRAFVDAGMPDGAVNLVFGEPAEVSEYLVPHPVIRKITFTGSTAVGKRLAALAGQHMKRATMELGGHAPAIVFDDADIDNAVDVLAAGKFRNAGQACISPSRFLVQDAVYERFVDRFAKACRKIRVGNGIDEDTQMGPLIHARRRTAMEALVEDAVDAGARIVTGGRRCGDEGFFFAPTVMTDVPKTARVMNEEPFGPLAPIAPFTDLDDAIAEANRLEFGLAAFVHSGSASTTWAASAAIESGMIAINHHGLALPEVPFGGIKDSGYGTEGGAEALDGYLYTKFTTHRYSTRPVTSGARGR